MSEALRLAHELILAMRDTDEEHWDTLEEAAAELRRLHAALAEPEQEPVAWAVYDILHGGSKTLHWPEQHSPNGDPKQYKAVPLYTAPTPRRPQTTHWEGCEAVHPECKTELERKSDAIQRLWKERDELRSECRVLVRQNGEWQALHAELAEALRWCIRQMPEPVLPGHYTDGYKKARAALAKVEARNGS